MTIKLIKGDITNLKIDAIVNAANNSLLGGGGVDGAIHRAGGPQILKECIAIRNKQGGCKTGEAVITSGGNLSAKYIIHTVGPIWHGGKHNEAAILANAYKNSLQLALANHLKNIAFPNISTGVYHFPKREAAEIAINTVKKFGEENVAIEEVYFVCYDDENYNIYQLLIY